MSAKAGEEIPRSEAQPEQPTPPPASGSEGERGTGISWREVLSLPAASVEQTPYARAKEQAGRKEAEVSPEALELAKDNFGELVYLWLKKPDLISKGDQLKNLIGQLSPELKKLFDQGATSLSAVEVVRTIQQEIDRIFSDDDSLSEQEKRIREVHRQQVAIIGLAFQEYKMQVVTKAYQISAQEEKPESSAEQEEQQIQEAKQKLQRPPNVLVFDEEGRIIPQAPELSEEDYVETYYRKMPVSLLDRILGRTQEVQRRKAAEEYENYKKLLEKQEGEKPVERKLIFKISPAGQKKQEQGNQAKLEGQENGDQVELDDNEKFLLTELGLMDKGQIKEAQTVLPEIMTQIIKPTLRLRQEILAATGVSGEQLFDNFKNLSPSLSMIPSLDKLTLDSLNTRIKEIIEKRRAENAQRIQQELEEAERGATISQLQIKEKKIEEELKKIKEKEAKEKGTGEETQPPEEGPNLNEIEDAIKKILDEYVGDLRQENLLGSNEQTSSLLDRNLPVMIKVLQAKAKGYRQELELRESRIKARIDPLQRQLEYLLRQKAEAKIVTSREKGVTTVEEPNLQGIDQEIKNLRDEIDKLWNENELSSIRSNLFTTEKQLAILQGIIESRVAIGGVSKTIGEWLEQYAIIKSKAGENGGANQGTDTGEETTKEQVEEELYKVRALIGYYSEDGLVERETRILQMKGLRPNDVFTNEYLAAVESRNPKLYELLPRTKDGNRVNIARAKRVLLVLYQVFGDEFIYPDDPNAEEVRGTIAILQAMGDLSKITSVEGFDEKMRELVNRYLKGALKLGSNNGQQPEAGTQQAVGST